jgi:Tol biopolymer transport system component/DNA-binding winged helix-turn-helix (wHTH) protein
MPVGEKQIFRFGPFQLDTQCGQLRKSDVGVKLQGQPVQILEILLENSGNLVTREEIRQRLWASDTFVDFDHSLNTAVKKLRQALGDEAETPRYIETLPKRGYRFIGEVDREEPKKEILDPLPVAVVATEPIELPQPVKGKRSTRWRWIAATASVALLATAAYWITKPPPQPRIVGSHVLTKTGNRKSFLMKPFTDRGSLYFTDERPSGPVILQVPAAGGEVSPGPAVKGDLRDISRDGSQLLSETSGPKPHYWEVWTQSLPAGLPRLVVKDAYWPLWSADGRGIFFSRFKDAPNDELYRANADGTAVERLATLPPVSYPHLSPDGTRILFTEGSASSDMLWEVGADGRNSHAILRDRKVVFGGVWSPDGKYYFFTGWDGDRMSLWAVSEARRWWRRNATVPQQLTFGPMAIGAPAISNDGKQLYAVGAERHGELSVYDSKLGKFVPYLSGASICYVDFSRDVQWIAYVSYPEGTLWRSRIDGSEKRQLTSPPLAVLNPRWSPDGKLIAFTDLSSGDRSQMTLGSPRRVYVVSADGGGPALLLAGQFEDPTWSPDGNSIAYDYNAWTVGWATEVRILDLQTQKSTKVPGSERMWSPRWSPDGKYLAALGSQAKLMLYSFATKTWEELDPGGHGWPCWSPDSKFIYAYSSAGDSLVRVAISDHKKETTAPMQGFRGTAYYFDRWNNAWSGATPDGRPIALRDTGIQELYAFDLEYK